MRVSVYLLKFKKLLFRLVIYRRHFLFECFLHAHIRSLLMSQLLCLLVSYLHSANTFFYLLHLSACTYWTLSKWMCRAHLWIAGQSLSAAPLYRNIVLPVLIWQPSAASGCRVADIPKRASPTFMPCGSICPLPPTFVLLVNGDTACSWLTLLPVQSF